MPSVVYIIHVRRSLSPVEITDIAADVVVDVAVDVNMPSVVGVICVRRFFSAVGIK